MALSQTQYEYNNKKMLPVVAASDLVSVGNEAFQGIAVALTHSARLVAFSSSMRKMIASPRERAVE